MGFSLVISFLYYSLFGVFSLHAMYLLSHGSGIDAVDGEGAVSSIASVLSPVLLAGGTCVDSFFSPELVPVSDLSLTCNEMQATLFHKTSSHPGTHILSSTVLLL